MSEGIGTINHRKSPLRNRPQAQNPPRACPATEPSPPVANPASGNQFHPTPYGGPSDANTRSVAGGSTTVSAALRVSEAPSCSSVHSHALPAKSHSPGDIGLGVDAVGDDHVVPAATVGNENGTGPVDLRL